MKHIHLTQHSKKSSQYFPSVQHYYHFMLGFFVPLIKFREKMGNTDNIIYIRSCGILDNIIQSLNYQDLKIIKHIDHAFMKICPANSKIDLWADMYGYDHSDVYSREVFQSVSAIIQSEFVNEINEAKQQILKLFPNNGPKVVLINRIAPHKFYSSDISEYKTAGSQRRSIKNISEIEHALLTAGVNLITTSLEDTTLWYQIALFQCADVVIAQHGAALANLIFSRSTLTVIEIFPPNQSPLYFRNLANVMGQGYVQVLQETNHSAVDMSAIMAAVKNILRDAI